eukprot:scaffold17946_cov73-Attheya_sp.AAC.1
MDQHPLCGFVLSFFESSHGTSRRAYYAKQFPLEAAGGVLILFTGSQSRGQMAQIQSWHPSGYFGLKSLWANPDNIIETHNYWHFSRGSMTVGS